MGQILRVQIPRHVSQEYQDMDLDLVLGFQVLGLAARRRVCLSFQDLLSVPRSKKESGFPRIKCGCFFFFGLL